MFFLIISYNDNVKYKMIQLNGFTKNRAVIHENEHEIGVSLFKSTIKYSSLMQWGLGNLLKDNSREPHMQWDFSTCLK
jgi:hypothetical protein